MPVIKNPLLRERNTLRIFGCTEAEALALNGGAALRAPGSIAYRYCIQRTAAHQRGIEWLITFPEWVQVWSASGHFSERGVGVGRYVMAREGDAGPYSVANVRIELAVVNSREGLETRREREKVFHAAD